MMMRRPAFALMTVIVCLAMAAMVMVSVAGKSLHLATESLERQRALQLRWGLLSCEKSVLRVAPEWFEDLEEQHRLQERPGPAPASLPLSVSLGRQVINLRIDDESAKVDLNATYHYLGRRGVERALAELMPGGRNVPIHVQTMVRSAGPPDVDQLDNHPPAAFAGFGQLIDLERVPESIVREQLPVWIQRLTVCQPGPLNVRRASDSAIEATFRLVSAGSSSREFIEKCREPNAPNVARLVEQLGMDGRDQTLLKTLLADHSTCYSVWATATSGRGRRLEWAASHVADDQMTAMEFCHY